MKRKGLEESPRRFRGPPKAAKRREHLSFGRMPGPKKAVNVTVDADILKIAKEMRINVSQVTEDALRKVTETERARRFYVENKAFFDRHNEYIERHGTLAEQFYGPDAFDDPTV